MRITYVGALSEGSIQAGEVTYYFHRGRSLEVPDLLGRLLVATEEFRPAQPAPPTSEPPQPAFLRQMIVKEEPEAEGGARQPRRRRGPPLQEG